MWHLVPGNRMRNGSIEGPKHAKCIHQKLHFWKFLWTMCSTTQSIVEYMLTRMMSKVFRCSRNYLSNQSPLCWFNEYVHVCVVVTSKSDSFCEQVLPVSGFLSPPFLTRFPHTRCHFQRQGFGNKMYISELFIVVGYLHTAGFKNRRGTFCAKCVYLLNYWEETTDLDQRYQTSYGLIHLCHCCSVTEAKLQCTEIKGSHPSIN